MKVVVFFITLACLIEAVPLNSQTSNDELMLAQVGAEAEAQFLCNLFGC